MLTHTCFAAKLQQKPDNLDRLGEAIGLLEALKKVVTDSASSCSHH